MINRIVLVGRMTRDPELRRTASGTAVASFSLAVNRSNERDEADFPGVTAFGRTAEAVSQYCRKGSLVGVDGRIQTGSYTDRNGNKVYTTDVIAQSVQFLETRKKQESASMPHGDDIPQTPHGPEGHGHADRYGRINPGPNDTDDSYGIREEDIEF